MLNGNSRVLSIASGLLAVLVCLGLACKIHRSEVVNDPIQVTVQPKQSKDAGLGELRVTLRNRSGEDLVFESNHLPWDYNAEGLDFVISREDGSVVHKTPMIADPIVGIPTLFKDGEEHSRDMSLLVYYVELPKELTLHDLKVNWRYFPKPTNLIAPKVLSGDFVLKKLTPGH